MKYTKLKAAVLAGIMGLGFAGTAGAVNVNPDGIGQVLFYPYYTSNGGNATLLSLVNTTDNAKAVKVRFMESQNSREVLDFNLYLSAHDVWAAAVVDVDGVPTLVINDTSCTAPSLYDVNDGEQPFLPFALTDGGPDDISRTAEGHIEVIEMGTVVGDSAVAVTHVAPEASTGGDGRAVPADCQSISDAWTVGATSDDDGYWITDPSVDMEAPSGGLFGGAAVINVQSGKMYSYDAKAINGFATQLQGTDYLHQVPGTALPSLNSGDVKTGSVFLDDGTLLVSDEFDRGVDAISFVFMHDNLMNEYTVEQSVAAAAEWVITFPTKSFYVDADVNGTDPENPTAVAPFTALWDGKGACEVVLIDSVYDREEQTYEAAPGDSRPPLVSPAPPTAPGAPAVPFELCYETNVIKFGKEDEVTASILGSSNVTYLDPASIGFDSGWVNLGMDDYVDSEGVSQSRTGLGGLEGLPVVGFATFGFSNGFLKDADGKNVLANYGGIFQHKATRKMSSDQ